MTTPLAGPRPVYTRKRPADFTEDRTSKKIRLPNWPRIRVEKGIFGDLQEKIAERLFAELKDSPSRSARHMAFARLEGLVSERCSRETIRVLHSRIALYRAKNLSEQVQSLCSQGGEGAKIKRHSYALLSQSYARRSRNFLEGLLPSFSAQGVIVKNLRKEIDREESKLGRYLKRSRSKPPSDEDLTRVVREALQSAPRHPTLQDMRLRSKKVDKVESLLKLWTVQGEHDPKIEEFFALLLKIRFLAPLAENLEPPSLKLGLYGNVMEWQRTALRLGNEVEVQNPALKEVIASHCAEVERKLGSNYSTLILIPKEKSLDHAFFPQTP